MAGLVFDAHFLIICFRPRQVFARRNAQLKRSFCNCTTCFAHNRQQHLYHPFVIIGTAAKPPLHTFAAQLNTTTSYEQQNIYHD
jgi:hypothetical protein